jgi:hypothetical protein
MAPCHGAVATSDSLRVARMTISKLIGKSRGKQCKPQVQMSPSCKVEMSPFGW